MIVVSRGALRGVLFAALMYTTAAQPFCHITRDLSLERVQNWPFQKTGISFADGIGATAADFSLTLSVCEASTLASDDGILQACAEEGFVALHATSGACLAVWDNVSVVAQNEGRDRNIELRFTKEGTMNHELVVNVSCDPGAADNLMIMDDAEKVVAVTLGAGVASIAALSATLDDDPHASFSEMVVQYRSRAACDINDNVCLDHPDIPAGEPHVFCPRHLRCIAGTCANTGDDCLAVKQNLGGALSEPGVNVRGSVEIWDNCRNVSIGGLGTEHFALQLDGLPVPNDREHAQRINRDVGFREQVMVTVGLDLSSSLLREEGAQATNQTVYTDDAEELRLAMVKLVEGLFDGRIMPLPKVALFGFDGNAELTTMKPSYTSDKDALLGLLQDSTFPWPSSDPHSSNFNGAIVELSEVATEAAQSVQGRRAIDGDSVDVSARSFIILLSDAEDTSMRTTEGEAIAAAESFLTFKDGNSIFVGAMLDSVVQAQIQQFPPARRNFLHRVTDSTDRTFFAYPSDLLDMASDLVNMTAAGATTYSVSMCVPVRDDNLHSVTATLDIPTLTVAGNGTWFFPGANVTAGCNASTLDEAARRRSAAPVVSTLPVLSVRSRTVNLAPPYPAYFLVDTEDVLDGRVIADSESATVPSVYIAPDNTLCSVVTKACFGTKSDPTGVVTLPNNGTNGFASAMLMGFVDFPDNRSRATNVTALRLNSEGVLVPTPPPIVSDTPPPVDDSSDDDGNLAWVTWVVVVLALLLLLASAAYAYVQWKNKQAGVAEDEEMRAQPHSILSPALLEHRASSSGAPPPPPDYRPPSLTTSVPSCPVSELPLLDPPAEQAGYHHRPPGPIEHALNQNFTRAVTANSGPPSFRHAPTAAGGSW
eukprot:TRINITY_DN15932_c0_g1_i1.p1 TRINITY_DN15932_c0_g1~~TRINITY_DN15932_c0_g1_i1.p1  ORF type:complete len:879 (+),score=116.81 TRINITY_DN15932_c0_g1_i1:78-2714(+)